MLSEVRFTRKHSGGRLEAGAGATSPPGPEAEWLDSKTARATSGASMKRPSS